jgi:hypothetical protein
MSGGGQLHGNTGLEGLGNTRGGSAAQFDARLLDVNMQEPRKGQNYS